MKQIIYLNVIILISLMPGKTATSQTNNTTYPAEASINIQSSNKTTMGPSPICIYCENYENVCIGDPCYGTPERTYFWLNGKRYRMPDYEHLSVTIENSSAGFTSHVLKTEPLSLGEPSGTPPSTTMNLRIGQYISVVKGKTYSVRFKASADSARNIDILCTQKFPPFDTALWIRETPLDTALTTYGSYLLNWGQNQSLKSKNSQTTKSTSTFISDESETDSMAFEFAIGASLIPVYLDDIEIIETSAPEINITQEDSIIQDNSGIFDFGNVIQGESKTVLFTIENTGSATLDLLGENTRVSVTQGNGFSLVSDAVSSIEEGEFSTFEIKYEPNETGVDTAVVTIENNDVSEEVYTFTVIGNSEVNTTSVKNSTIKNPAVNVYPNPTTNHIKVDVCTSMNGDVAAEIIDLQGRSLLKATRKATDTGMYSFTWDLKELNSGIYFVKVSVGSRLIKTCKIILRE